MDIPKDARRMHTKAMPRFGGMAIFIGTMVSLIIFAGQNEKILPVLIGGTLIYILGVVDDLKNLPAKVKFGAQLLVAVLMYVMGLRIKFITDYFGEGVLHFGAAVCFIVTILWIVGITNTINLICLLYTSTVIMIMIMIKQGGFHEKTIFKHYFESVHVSDFTACRGVGGGFPRYSRAGHRDELIKSQYILSDWGRWFCYN